MNSICYLCNKIINLHDKKSDDHVVPKLLIDRAQPKVKGFDYGDKIETHETCNNHFGPETYCRKALKIISKLSDSECASILIHKENQSIRILVLNSECFDEFTNEELSYFGIRDVRENTLSEIKNPEFIENGTKTDIKQKILFNSFAVLVKSAAALLIKRIFKKIPSQWKVIAVPYHGETLELNFNEILGETKPFDKNVKIYLKDLNGGMYLILYIAYDAILYLFFQLVENEEHIREIVSKFPEADCYLFTGSCINDLIGYNWLILK